MPKHAPRRSKNPNTASAGRPRRAVLRPWCELRIPLAAGDTAALAAVRRLARAALEAWDIGPEKSQDVLLVLSELVTNALVHTTGPARVRLVHRAGQIHLHVTDTARTALNLDAGHELEAEHGYGLACIAAAYADEINVTMHPRRGKTVSAAFGVSR